jgi:hypothetical protein
MMRNQDYRNKKISLNILIWVLVVFVFFSLNQLAKNYQLQKQLSKIKKDSKDEIEQRIKQREIIIYELRKDNNYKRMQIDKMNQKIDSLEKVKSKIKIKYINIKKNINDMDAQKIKKYWNEEFN